eukprot:gene11528-12718_t
MLKRDEIGVTAVPSTNLPDQPTTETINKTGGTDREKRYNVRRALKPVPVIPTSSKWDVKQIAYSNNKLLEEHISRYGIGAFLNRDKLNDTGDIEDISEDDMSCDEGMDIGSEYEEMSEGNNNESEYEEM